MKYQHLGYRIKGFYKIASFSNKLEAMMATDDTQKLNALEFWDKYGLIATKDFHEVSRSTLYRWRKRRDEFGVSALQDASKAPHHRRRRNWCTRITDVTPQFITDIKASFFDKIEKLKILQEN